MTTHDPSYKLLFSHREMVRDLLLGFIDEPWVAELDLDTLEPVSGRWRRTDPNYPAAYLPRQKKRGRTERSPGGNSLL